MTYLFIGMVCGIYKITNKNNNKFYIGSAINCLKRWYKKYNKYLEAAFEKYGRENFLFEIIEKVDDPAFLLIREQYWLDLLEPWRSEIGYNFRKIAESNIGIKMSEESKLKMSEKRKGRKVSDKTKQKISDALKGREITWKDKIREANSGENNYNYGNTLSNEWKEKISKSLKDRPKSKEHCDAISKGKKGKKFSEEHKQKLSESAKKRWKS